MNKVKHPFWVIVHKEIADHVHSLRFIILISIIVLTCMGALYTALTNIGAAIKPDDPDGSFLFLKLFTVSDGTLPSFVLFINFLGPLLGIALGFDAVNSEQNKGTLSRMLAQPIHRDCIINAKFVAALIGWAVLFFVLPMAITSPEYIIDQYKEWHVSLAGKNMENMFSKMQNQSLLGRCAAGVCLHSDEHVAIRSFPCFHPQELRAALRLEGIALRADMV